MYKHSIHNKQMRINYKMNQIRVINTVNMIKMVNIVNIQNKIRILKHKIKTITLIINNKYKFLIKLYNKIIMNNSV